MAAKQKVKKIEEQSVEERGSVQETPAESFAERTANDRPYMKDGKENRGDVVERQPQIES